MKIKKLRATALLCDSKMQENGRAGSFYCSYTRTVQYSNTITSDMHVILRGEPELMCACAIRCCRNVLVKCKCKNNVIIIIYMYTRVQIVNESS